MLGFAGSVWSGPVCSGRTENHRAHGHTPSQPQGISKNKPRQTTYSWGAGVDGVATEYREVPIPVSPSQRMVEVAPSRICAWCSLMENVV